VYTSFTETNFDIAGVQEIASVCVPKLDTKDAAARLWRAGKHPLRAPQASSELQEAVRRSNQNTTTRIEVFRR
jgi:hypothetical protein